MISELHYLIDPTSLRHFSLIFKVIVVFQISFFYTPNFGEVEGAYWFGPVRPSTYLSVCRSITHFVSYESQELLMPGSSNFIYFMHMKYKWTRFFFISTRLVNQGFCPLFDFVILYSNSLVNKIPGAA